MTRLEYFHEFKNHPWFGRLYKRLSERDMEIAVDFILKNDHLPIGEFEFAINRMFLDKEKPKQYKIILELLTCANSSLR